MHVYADTVGLNGLANSLETLMGQRKIPLTDLKVGMFLIGVDCSWLRTPFLRHRFKIHDLSEIETLRRSGIVEVTIDPEQGIDIEGRIAVQETSSESPRSDLVPTQESPHSLRLAENFAQAKQRRAEWMKCLNALFERTRMTGLVEYDVARQLVDDMVGVIVDQQAACFAVLGLRQSDPTLHEHGLTVCTLSVILGQALGQPRDVLQHLGVGALLHDIGLAQLPRNIIKRPKAMPPAQQALYRTHSALGVAAMEKCGATDPAVLGIVQWHHDLVPQSDASGAAAVPSSELARLVGLVDEYDELVTGQTGLIPMSSNQALTQLYQRYRPYPELMQVVSYLIKGIGVYPLYSVVALNSGELAVVGAITPGKAHLPLVYLCRDASGRPCVPPIALDFSAEAHSERRIHEVRDATREGVDIEDVLRQVAA